MSDVLLYKNNTSPSVIDTITVDGQPFDLTGSTIRFQARDPRSGTLVIDAAGAQITILNQTTNKGGVQYDPVAGDVATSYVVPPLVGWWDVTLPSGKKQDTPETFNVFIYDHAPAFTGDLCTITDVKQGMEPSLKTTARDGRIAALISSVSREIMDELERELVPLTAGATRTFPVTYNGERQGIIVPLVPFDLRAATTATLHPEASSPRVLTANVEYVLEPVNKPQGSYGQVRLSNLLPLTSDFSSRFGFAQLSIAGDWGLFSTATVPRSIVEAAVLTVRAQMRQNPAAYAYAEQQDPGSLTPTIPETYGIPPAALKKLRPWRRMYA